MVLATAEDEGVMVAEDEGVVVAEDEGVVVAEDEAGERFTLEARDCM